MIIGGRNGRSIDKHFEFIQVLRAEADGAGIKFFKYEGDELSSPASNGFELEDTGFLIAETPLEVRSDSDEVLGFLPLALVLFVVVLALTQDYALGQVEVLAVDLKLIEVKCTLRR